MKNNRESGASPVPEGNSILGILASIKLHGHGSDGGGGGAGGGGGGSTGGSEHGFPNVYFQFYDDASVDAVHSHYVANDGLRSKQQTDRLRAIGSLLGLFESGKLYVTRPSCFPPAPSGSEAGPPAGDESDDGGGGGTNNSNDAVATTPRKRKGKKKGGGGISPVPSTSPTSFGGIPTFGSFGQQKHQTATMFLDEQYQHEGSHNHHRKTGSSSSDTLGALEDIILDGIRRGDNSDLSDGTSPSAVATALEIEGLLRLGNILMIQHRSGGGGQQRHDESLVMGFPSASEAYEGGGGATGAEKYSFQRDFTAACVSFIGAQYDRVEHQGGADWWENQTGGGESTAAKGGGVTARSASETVTRAMQSIVLSAALTADDVSLVMVESPGGAGRGSGASDHLMSSPTSPIAGSTDFPVGGQSPGLVSRRGKGKSSRKSRKAAAAAATEGDSGSYDFFSSKERNRQLAAPTAATSLVRQLLDAIGYDTLSPATTLEEHFMLGDAGGQDGSHIDPTVLSALIRTLGSLFHGVPPKPRDYDPADEYDNEDGEGGHAMMFDALWEAAENVVEVVTNVIVQHIDRNTNDTRLLHAAICAAGMLYESGHLDAETRGAQIQSAFHRLRKHSMSKKMGRDSKRDVNAVMRFWECSVGNATEGGGGDDENNEDGDSGSSSHENGQPPTYDIWLSEAKAPKKERVEVRGFCAYNVMTCFKRTVRDGLNGALLRWDAARSMFGVRRNMTTAMAHHHGMMGGRRGKDGGEDGGSPMGSPTSSRAGNNNFERLMQHEAATARQGTRKAQRKEKMKYQESHHELCDDE